MPARKMKVEVYDGSGSRYTVTIEGSVTREKAIRILEIVELLGGMPSQRTDRNMLSASSLQKIEQIRTIVEEKFPIVWFSSKDVKTVYEKELHKPISQSMVSTYLSRLTNRGLLMRRKVSKGYNYRMATKNSQELLKILRK